MKLVTVSIALFIKDINAEGFCAWMQVREDTGALNGKWEFPGGKIESGETSEIAMRREVLEEVGIDITDKKAKLFKLYPYQYANKTICLFPFLVEAPEIEKAKGEWFSIDYKSKSKPLENKIPEANIPLINEVCDYLQSLVRAKAEHLLWN